MVKSFKELTPKLQPLAGGKGGMLARMFQGGYPVPEGFVVLPQAFEGETLIDEAWNEIRDYLNKIRKENEGALFAVRSSALSEDSARASFAGEFETVLNVETDKEIRQAIYTVFRSGGSERVKVYSTAQGIEQSHKIAVVVQLMVPSEISGVLFTADPVTGSFEGMIGNYVYGLGEQLVSGEKDAFDFILKRPRGRYDGPREFKKYASILHKYASRLEKETGSPQDIEWAMAEGKLYILQARPVTTLTPGSPDTYEMNESLAEDTIWVNTNVAEAIPDVVTPLTWSIVRALDIETNLIPGYYLWSGNICGRIYTNIGKRLSAITAMYGSPKMGLKLLGEVFGQLPENLTIPVWPISRAQLIKTMFPGVKYYLKKNREASKNMSQFIEDTPGWCKGTKEDIKKINTREELLNLWKHQLEPYNRKAWWGLMAGGASAVIALTLRNKLIKLTGTEDANALLSNIREDSGLESLGPVIGISKVVKGEMSREEYLVRYGHRGPHEFELSIPDPIEDEAWLERQIQEFKNSDTDVEGLLNKQHTLYQAARKRFEGNFPSKAKWLARRLKRVSESARIREAARSEFVRVFRVVRAFALKAGELAGIGEDVFFLYINEVEELLEGDKSALKHVPARKENFQKYNTLPTFPTIIRGRFDPFEWVKDPDRRMDYYDASLPAAAAPDSGTIQGFAGAAGRVEGTVRVLANPEEGEKLVQGEILVAATTNVGWTPLFPRAAAVITDVGAPLSHAAIVARELGIPAVVGCGIATARLKDGDRVLVDGGQGVVYIKS